MISPATLIAAFAFGAVGAYLAQKRKKNPYVWFCIGFFFGLIGLFAIFFLPLKQKRGRKRTAIVKPIPTIEGPSDKFWYYLDPTHNQIGPVSYQAITKFLHTGEISRTTYVWHEEMSDWKKLDDLVVLK